MDEGLLVRLIDIWQQKLVDRFSAVRDLMIEEQYVIGLMEHTKRLRVYDEANTVNAYISDFIASVHSLAQIKRHANLEAESDAQF